MNIKTILSFIFIIVIAVVSQWFVDFFNIKFPGSLFGMLALATLMYFKVVDIKFVELSGNFFLKHITLFFVPLLVAAIAYSFNTKDNFLIIFIVFLITSFLLIIFTGLTVQYLLMKKIYKKKRLKNKFKKINENSLDNL